MPVNSTIKEDFMQEQILQAAKQLFQVHGLHKVTMDDVAKAIGKGRSSLYYYYKSKDEIFEAVMDLEIGEMLTAMTRAVEQAYTAGQKIRAFCLTKLWVLREKNAFFKTLDAGMDAEAISLFNRTRVVHHNRIIREEGALLRQVMTKGIEKGELKPMAADEMEKLIFIILSGLRGIKREMVIENSFDKLEPVINTFTDMILYGIGK